MHVLVSWSAILASVACLIGWALAFYANGVSNVLLYWLPLAPVGGIVVAYYVDGDISSLAADMVALESKKYNLKDV